MWPIAGVWDNGPPSALIQLSPVADLDEIKQRAITVVSGCAYGPPELIRSLLQPTPEDYAAVFVGDAAQKFQEAYASFWEKPPAALTRTAGARVLMFPQLAQNIVESDQFPGGYAKVAHLLVPDQTWFRFKLVADGGRDVMAYDGLVARGDRFVWFPKPWRALGMVEPAGN